MWGIVPAAGRGTRIQPLAFSKELLPVGSRLAGEVQRPRAVAEYLLERMLRAGVDKICFVIGEGKSDILEYFGAEYNGVRLAYVVQPGAAGLCDALFRARPLIGADEQVVIGLPDTIWFPADALAGMPADELSFLLFPVAEPQFFDAVLLDEADRVREIRVKQPDPGTPWIWGAFRMPARVFGELHDTWLAREPRDEYIGTLVNAWLAAGGRARGCRLGESYLDVGTLGGYRAAMALLAGRDEAAVPAPPTRLPAGTRHQPVEDLS
jgi:dTDP-glucose pyrophosphorylase